MWLCVALSGISEREEHSKVGAVIIDYAHLVVSFSESCNCNMTCEAIVLSTS